MPPLCPKDTAWFSRVKRTSSEKGELLVTGALNSKGALSFTREAWRARL